MAPSRTLIAATTMILLLGACDFEFRDPEATRTPGPIGPGIQACRPVPTGRTPTARMIGRGLERAQEELAIDVTSVRVDEQGIADATDCDLLVIEGRRIPHTGDARTIGIEENTMTLQQLVLYSNTTEVTFDLRGASFLAGYVAAARTDTGTVGVFAEDLASTTRLLRAFARGVAQRNDDSGSSVEVLGLPKSGASVVQNLGSEKAASLTSGLAGQGADIVFSAVWPGSIVGAAEAAASSNIDLIGAEFDGCKLVEEDLCEVFLTSVVKRADIATFDILKRAITSTPLGADYRGDLVNGWAGLAPFHRHRDEISRELRNELDELQRRLISGEIAI
jgi:basic membrane protein A